MATEPKTVLTVDDSKVVRVMVARALEPYGCRIIEATNGQEGIEAAERHRPDLILLDVTMPVMDGRATLAALRKSDACRTIPVIMLTAERTQDVVIGVAKLGVSGYILKPFDQATFDCAVGKVLGPPNRLDRDTVLVIDDSERVLAAARAALETTLKVVTATSAKEGLERYREGHPAVVVIDLVMPDMDGFETLTRIRELGRSACVALGVRGESGIPERALKAGYHSVVAKPFQADGLVEAVQAALLATRSTEELVKTLLTEDAGCTVLTLGSPPAGLARLLPALRQALRALAEDGGDRLIVELCAGADAELLKVVGQVLAHTQTLGVRTVLCGGVEAELRKTPALREATFAPDRAAARQALDGPAAAATPQPEGA